MIATILPLPGLKAPTTAIGHYIRLGHASQRMESLLAQGRFEVTRVVVEASELRSQRDLIATLRARGVELVLDTNVDELSELGRYSGYVKSAPWAKFCEGGPLSLEHFKKSHPSDLIGMIARAAVQHGMSAVLAPSHFLRAGSRDDWFRIDVDSCIALRASLDREGGENIALDYPLICSYADLRDEAVRGSFVAQLHDAPFENLFLRVSGFGADATAVGCTRYISAVSNMHNLGKPIIADSLGGLVGLSTIAFGAVGGLCHGVGEEERFSAADWHKPRAEKGGGGRTIRIAIPGLGKSLTEVELRALARSSGGLRLVSCGNRGCCPHGIEDMIKNWRAHALRLATDSIRELESVPDLRRTRHFLDNNVIQATQIAHKISSLKVLDEKFEERLKLHSRRMDEFRSTLNNLEALRGELPVRPLAVRDRSTFSKNAIGRDSQ